MRHPKRAIFSLFVGSIVAGYAPSQVGPVQEASVLHDAPTFSDVIGHGVVVEVEAAALGASGSQTGNAGSVRSATQRPGQGVVIARTFSRLDKREVTTGDGENQSKNTTTRRLTLEVADRVLAVDASRVTKLERTFNDVSGRRTGIFEIGPVKEETSSTGSSLVEGKTLLLTWDQENDRYRPACDSIGDQLLRELRCDYECAVLAPPVSADMEEGWTVNVDAFLAMINPWEGLPLEWDAPERLTLTTTQDGWGAPTTDTSSGGRITAIHVGNRNIGNVTLASLELAGTFSRSQSMRWQLKGGGSGRVVTKSSEYFSIVHGEALWDPEAGRLHSLNLELSVSGREYQDLWFAPRSGGEAKGESDDSFRGSIAFEATFTVEAE